MLRLRFAPWAVVLILCVQSMLAFVWHVALHVRNQSGKYDYVVRLVTRSCLSSRAFGARARAERAYVTCFVDWLVALREGERSVRCNYYNSSPRGAHGVWCRVTIHSQQPSACHSLCEKRRPRLISQCGSVSGL